MSGEEKPTKTGVCVMIKQFNQLIDIKSEIQQNLIKSTERQVNVCTGHSEYDS